MSRRDLYLWIREIGRGRRISIFRWERFGRERGDLYLWMSEIRTERGDIFLWMREVGRGRGDIYL
jgi:hypothetical protein